MRLPGIFHQDPQTKVILLYIEGVRNGKRFFHALREAAAVKPVVVIKGGRGQAGTRATASHTASMAGSRQIWKAMTAQAGVITANDIEDLVDVAVALYHMPPIRGRRVAVAGGSGGSSVLAADLCEESGLDVIPLPQDIRDELKRQGNPIWDWINNPADFSIGVRSRDDTIDIMKMMAKHPDFDFLMIFVHGPWRRDSEPFDMDKHLEPYRLQKETDKPLAIIYNDRPRGDTEEGREMAQISTAIQARLIAENFAFYPTAGRAARAINKVIEYYENKGA